MRIVNWVGVVAGAVLAGSSAYEWWNADGPETTLWVAAMLVFLDKTQEWLRMAVEEKE